MIPYLALIFISLSFLYVSFVKQKGRLAIVVGTDAEVQNRSLLIPVFFIIYFLLLALRHETIGADILNYKRHFESTSAMSIGQIFNRDSDMLYYLLNWLVSRFTNNYRIFLIIVAGITIVPLAKFYSEDREYGFLKMILFINMPNFVMIFSGLRQAIAVSLCLIAYKYVKEKKIWPFLLWAFIAMGFHHSGFMVFTIYPLYYANFKRKHLWYVIPVIALIFIYNEVIFGAATVSLTWLFGQDYDAVITDTGAYTMLILFALFAVLSYVLPDENVMDEETLGLRNILLAALAFQMFVPLNTLAMRLNYYFIIFIPVLIPKIIKCCKFSLRQYGYLSNWVLSGYLLVYYLDKLYTSCTTGISSLSTYPYAFFWQ